MAGTSWKIDTLEDGRNAVRLEQVLHLAEEMFDTLADRLRHKVEEQCSPQN
jgi:hypothetical protein